MSNRLKNESSPYLLQHAQNPVDWYPWGEEAFEKARREDKPVFLSIGYSTCHWCHVMAHESFENHDIADILNQNFISIKVDREERPDVDRVYMAVCQALTGSGGWPVSIFLTPEQKPFYAGTYFPPVSQYGMIGFGDLLLAIVDKWKTQRPHLLKSAEEILSHMQMEEGEIHETMEEQLPKKAAEQFLRSFDKENGGFGQAPKFPTAHNLIFLILYSTIYKDKNALKQATFTLEKMRRGGIFDQIGYGFSRYSTDAYFLVPHFEKMLYDNGLLIL
ncbi:MAG: thioredoxin domain-containing protein, partial [Candidatus Fimousia sp.]